jgi:hypothetical protein
VLRFLESKRDPVDAYLELDQRWPGKGWDIAAQSQRELRATIREKMERYEAPAPPEPPEEERKYIQERASKIRSLFGDAE